MKIANKHAREAEGLGKCEMVQVPERGPVEAKGPQHKHALPRATAG